MESILLQQIPDEQLDRGGDGESAPVNYDTIAWKFLGSEFTDVNYANWPIERRVDSYMAHHGPTDLLNNGDAHAAVLQRVMANIGAAQRNGTLATTTWETSRGGKRYG